MSSVKIREKKLKNNRRSLYLDIYIDKNNRYTEFLNLHYYTNDKEMKEKVYRIAKKCRNLKELEIMDNQNNENNFKKNYKLKRIFEIKKKQVKSKETYNNTWKHFIKVVDENIKVGNITVKDIKKFKKHLKETGLKQNSRNTYYNCFKSVLNYAYKNNFLKENLTKNIDPVKKKETKKVFLTEKEIKKISKVKNLNTKKKQETKRAFLFSCYTGLRLSDIIKLDYSMIENNKIHFRQQKTTSYEYMPLSKTAVKLIEPMQEKGKVFDLPSPQWINHYIKEITDKADIDKHITYHSSRHTFATMCLSNGVDIYTVSKLLGHKSIETTQVYANIIDSKKQEAVDKLPEL